MDEGAPKSKKLTKEEARLQLVRETSITIYQKLFTSLEYSDPILAAELKPHFDEFIKTEMEMMGTDPKGEHVTFNDIQQKIPNNRWIQYLKFVAELSRSMPLSQGEKERVSKEFQQDVKKRIEGKDIN